MRESDKKIGDDERGHEESDAWFSREGDENEKEELEKMKVKEWKRK